MSASGEGAGVLWRSESLHTGIRLNPGSLNQIGATGPAEQGKSLPLSLLRLTFPMLK